MFVILETNWQYNDEYYYEGGGGDPRSVFTSREKADAECRKMNADQIRRGWCEFVTGDGIDDDEIIAKYNAIIAKYGDKDSGYWIDPDDYYFDVSMPDLTDEDAYAIADLLPVTFFTVQEVEKGD